MIFHANISFNDSLDKLSKTYWRDSRFSWGMILSVPSLGYADEGSLFIKARGMKILILMGSHLGIAGMRNREINGWEEGKVGDGRGRVKELWLSVLFNKCEVWRKFYLYFFFYFGSNVLLFYCYWHDEKEKKNEEMNGEKKTRKGNISKSICVIYLYFVSNRINYWWNVNEKRIREKNRRRMKRKRKH